MCERGSFYCGLFCLQQHSINTLEPYKRMQLTANSVSGADRVNVVGLMSVPNQFIVFLKRMVIHIRMLLYLIYGS